MSSNANNQARGRKSAGYGTGSKEASVKKAVVKTVDGEGVSESAEDREEILALLAEEREAKLADLRAQKAQLLAMKAARAPAVLEAKRREVEEAKRRELMEEKEREARLAYVEEGKHRQLTGFALKEYADQKMEEVKQSAMLSIQKQNNGELDEAKDGNKEEATDKPDEAVLTPKEGHEDSFGIACNVFQEDPDEKRRVKHTAQFVANLPTKNATQGGHRTRKSQMPSGDCIPIAKSTGHQRAIRHGGAA